MHHRDGMPSTLRTSEGTAGIRVPVHASTKGGVWRSIPAEMPSPAVARSGPFVRGPSPVLPVARGWLHTLAVVAKFEPSVLYGRGSAQVGFGDCLSSFHRLTLSSDGILSPEPLRLTHPAGLVPVVKQIEL
jgi:hypothetical protein